VRLRLVILVFDLEATTQFLLDRLAEQGLPILFLAALLEGIPIVSLLPGEVVLAAGGYLIQQGEMPGGQVVLAVLLGALLADHLAYAIGRIGGIRLVRRLPYQRFLSRAERITARYGGLVIVVGRFSGLRGGVMFVVGAMGFPYRRFLPYELLGATFWTLSRLAIGAVGGVLLESLPENPMLQKLLLFALLGLIYLGWRHRKTIKRFLLLDEEPDPTPAPGPSRSA
jgi:membrane protein DedA with SNARE-associated domain